jgi:acyl transferase domain-containing protein
MRPFAIDACRPDRRSCSKALAVVYLGRSSVRILKEVCMAFAFVFPGQGSQAVAMMAAYGDSAVVRATFDEASAALDQDLWQLLADGPAEALAQTVNTQPVMLSAGVAVYRLWLDMGGEVPTVVAGHSLGEYTALVVCRRHRLQGCGAAGSPACGGDAGSGPCGRGGDGRHSRTR